MEYPNLSIPDQLPDDFLSNLVFTQDRRPELSREGQRGPIHASSLIGDAFCPRREWLQRNKEERIYQGVASPMRVVWKFGRAVEEHIRKQLIRNPSFRDKVYGHWECSSGDAFIGPYMDIPEHNRNHHDQVYHEICLVHRGVTGSPDLLFLNDDDEMVVVEIKSIKKDDFMELRRPIPIHSQQVQFYSNLLQRNDFTVNHCRVLYVCKDFVRGGIYKEYRISRTSVNDYEFHYEDAEAAQSEEIPRRLGVCSSPSSPKVMSCPCGVRCMLLHGGISNE